MCWAHMDSGSNRRVLGKTHASRRVCRRHFASMAGTSMAGTSMSRDMRGADMGTVCSWASWCEDIHCVSRFSRASMVVESF